MQQTNTKRMQEQLWQREGSQLEIMQKTGFILELAHLDIITYCD